MSFRHNPDLAEGLRSLWQSMTLRLMALSIVSSALVLLGVTGLSYHFLQTSLQKEEEHFLNDTGALLENILIQQETLSNDFLSQNLMRDFQSDIAAFHDNPFELMLQLPDQSVAFKTPGFANLPQALVLPAVEAENNPPPNQNVDAKTLATARKKPPQPIRFSAGQHQYAMIIRGINLPKIQPKSMTMFLVLDATRNAVLLNTFRQQMATVLLLGIFVSSALVFLIVRQGLLPLANMSEIVQSIQPATLEKRLGNRWPRELLPLARTFDKLLVRLDQVFRQMSVFCDDVAHEFRTPVANLRGTAEVMVGQPHAAQEYEETLYSQIEEFDRLSRMVDKLLFIAQAERSDLSLEKTQFYAAQEVQSVLEYFEPLIVRKNLAVSVEGDALVFADKSLFRRILSNLLSNAVKYTPEEGQIRITLHPHDDLSVALRFQDTGCGISAENLSKIFDRFYREDPARHDAEGTGLGLTLVKTMVTLHQGDIAVESTKGQGTTFVITLPGDYPSSRAK